MINNSCSKEQCQGRRRANGLCHAHAEALRKSLNPTATKAYKSKQYFKHRDKILKKNQDYYQRNKERIKDRTQAHTYGLSLEEHRALLEDQGGVCGICKGTNPKGKRLAIDHCHATGKVRAFLCSACNTGLGHFKDNISILEFAIKYLVQHGS